MRQLVFSAGGMALLALLVSGCSISSLRPAPATAAVASVAAAPSSAATATDDDAESAGDLSMVTAFAAPIVPDGAEAASSQAAGIVPLSVSFAAAAGSPPPAPPVVPTAPVTGLDALITHYSLHYAVPERLVRRVILRESRYNPAARNGPYYGLMQISHATARGMGYGGAAGGLLDAETNLRYAVKYLRGAYMVAQGNEDRAVRFYASGYYYDAKRMGLLEEVGLR